MVEKWRAFTCNFATPGSRGDVTRRCCVVARHVNRENAGRTTHFGAQCSLPLIICSRRNISVLWLFTVTFDDTKPPPKAVNCNMKFNSTPTRRVTPPRVVNLHGKMRPRLTGQPYLADRATRLGGLPHLSCKHDQIKIRDYMERRVTPPRRVTSPTWGPPPPCKQALCSKLQ